VEAQIDRARGDASVEPRERELLWLRVCGRDGHGEIAALQASRHQRPHVAVSGAAKSSWASATEEGEGMIEHCVNERLMRSRPYALCVFC